MRRSVPGVTLKDWGQRKLWNLPTPGNKVRARLPANDSARRPATLYPKSRPYSRYPARCSLQAPERGYRLLCGIFHKKVDLGLPLYLQRPCTPVTAFSQTSSFLEPRIFKSSKSRKPVCKTYRLESSIFFHITTFS